MHKDDINTVDWSKVNTNLIATGSNDKKVCVIDIRKLSNDSLDISSLSAADFGRSPIVKTFEGHTEHVLSVRFCPFNARFLLSSAESVKIWDLEA
jgi:WD40 repeat protein